jgi:hypothetical protein
VLVVLVLYEFDILTQYSNICSLCVCLCVCLWVGAAYLVCGGMSHFGVLGVFFVNDRRLV